MDRPAVRRALLGGIIVVALVLRLAGLGDALGHDEGYSWLVASSPESQFLDRLAQFENAPPLFYLLLRPLPLDDEAWLRVPALLPAVATVPVLYAVMRPLVGTGGALLAALGLAVAPYHVSYSNVSRGYMLATFGLLLATWAAVRLAQGGRRRWWCLFLLGGTIAMYSQYYAPLFLIALAGALIVLGRPRRETVLLGIASVIAIVPWVPQALQSVEGLNRTKVAPIGPDPGWTSLREALLPLFFGQHGVADGALRDAQLALLLIVLGAAGTLVWKRGSRAALVFLAGVSAAMATLHFAVGLLGPDIFQRRYLTAMIPLAAGLLAAAVVTLRLRWAAPAAAIVLVGLGVGILATRLGRELEPDGERIAALVRAHNPRTVLTNSAPMAYYLRDIHALLDRSLGFGAGREGDCLDPCVIVDDERFPGGVRSGPGRRIRAGPVVIRVRTVISDRQPR
jgi:uncharacterized membrane protein